MLPRLLVRVLPNRPTIAGLAATAVSLAMATAAVWALQLVTGAPTVAIYLLAVVALGMAYGTWPAIGTAICSFLVYDFLFVQPRYTFTIASAEEWVDLLVFLVVAIAIGRLSALQLERRREAELRGAEARAMFAMSRDISNAATALEAAPLLAARLAREAEMSRVWVGLGDAIPEERVVADTSPDEPRPSVPIRWTLHSGTADAQPSWVKVRETTVLGAREGRDAREVRLRQYRDDGPLTVLRVPIHVGGEVIGSVWAIRPRRDPFPGRSHSRLIGAAADQLGQSVVRDRLAAEATAVEVARQGDALKSALLDSVSHDLRTPLAAIRAAAGNLMDTDVELKPEEARAVAGSIDREAQRLSRLVRNMLDLSRIEGGALHPSLELYDPADLIDQVVERMAPALAPAEVEVHVPPDLPAVRVDAIFVDQILTNLLENAARHAAGKQISVSASVVAGQVWVVVGDAGPGVSVAVLPHLFERFYRAPRRQGSRADGGSGIGLAVVKGLTEAMGGSVLARPSPMGGLEIIVRLAVEYEPKVVEAVEPEDEPDGNSVEPVEPVEPQPAAAPAVESSGTPK